MVWDALNLRLRSMPFYEALLFGAPPPSHLIVKSNQIFGAAEEIFENREQKVDFFIEVKCGSSVLRSKHGHHELGALS